MNKPLKKVEKGNRNITDFFARRPSTSVAGSSQPPSSQPSSSQPTQSQKLGPRTGPKKANGVVKPRAVSISSDSDAADDKAEHGCISISSTSTTDDSIVFVAGAGSKSKTRPSAAKKPLKPLKKTFTPSQSQSSAKTTVKRRVARAAAGATPTSSTRPAMRRKRKVDWDDSSEDEMFKPDPSAMKDGLTRAPVPRALMSSNTNKDAVTSYSPSSLSSLSGASKRRRTALSTGKSAAEYASGEDEEGVPSSISDEQELVIPKTKKSLRNRGSREIVDKRRRETSVADPTNEPCPPLTDSPLTSPSERSPTPEIVSLPPDPATDATEEDPMMDVDMTDAANLLHNTQEHQDSDAEVSQQLITREESPLSSLSSSTTSEMPPFPSRHETEPESWEMRPATPPLASEPPPLPPTPVALTVATKTAQTIARIKAAAEAAAREHQDHSEEELLLEGLSDDSDIESLELKLKPARRSTPSKPSGPPSSPLTSMAPSSEHEQSEAGPSTRYNFRRRSSPSDKRSRPGSPGSDIDSPRQLPPPKKKAINPLDKLLREKQKDVRSGKGMEGIRLAEAALQDKDLVLKNKGKMREEMDLEEDSDDEMWANVDAHRGTRHFSLSACDGQDGSDSEGEGVGSVDLDIAEATKHLGDEQGAAVGKILDTDRKGWLRKGKTKRKVGKGVALWRDPASDADLDMTQDIDLPTLPLDQESIETDRVLNILQSTISEKDTVQLSGLLRAYLLSRSNEIYRPQLVSWLFSLLLYSDPIIRERAYEALLSPVLRTSVRLSLSALFASALAQLGASSELLAGHGLNTRTEAVRDSAPSIRLDSLTRIISVLKTLAHDAAIAPEDAPDLIIALVLVGLDPSTPAELQSEIMVVIDIAGEQMPSSSSGYSDMEPPLCSRLFDFAKGMTAENRAHLLTLFCGASPQMGRIKRWLSHSLLIGADTFKPTQYTALPPLGPFVDILSPVSGSKTIFDVVGGAEEDGYFDNLLHYIDILSAALTNIPGYVAEERASGHGSTLGRCLSPEKAKTELQQIMRCLDLMHGKIVDTRAAHLDRSRAKAAIQQLSFRLHYQREAALKAGRSNRHGLQSWLSKSKATF